MSICRHVTQGLGAHHAPDVFHVQQEVSRAGSGSPAGQVRQAEKEVTAAEKKGKQQEAARKQFA
ncbi:MAG: hypothetical protein ACE5EY_14405, partial [Anaerolineae bacterium]